MALPRKAFQWALIGTQADKLKENENNYFNRVNSNESPQKKEQKKQIQMIISNFITLILQKIVKNPIQMIIFNFIILTIRKISKNDLRNLGKTLDAYNQ